MSNVKDFRFLLYKVEQEDVIVKAFIQNETLWLTQKLMAELFGVNKSTISRHLKNIYEEKELVEHSTVAFFATVQNEGEREITRNIAFYNLDAIISVGYRVNSMRATHFRIWATNILKEYIQKGFVLDDERLKQGKKAFGKDYFRELLERVRSIRSSERRIYQQITDIFAECSIDYDKEADITKKFYATIQNKFHYAIAGHTAAEIIYYQANHEKEHMGLTTWKNAPDGKILKSDVTVSKNYLSQKELSGLNDIVNMYLDYAENQAKRNKLMSMNDWITKLDSFLNFNEYDIMQNIGVISRKVADSLAIKEYEKYRIIQDDNYSSDFDKATEKYL